ncbi:MAG: alanine--tRNA ligase [Tissierellia bacterium]|nr:alanine--tRNA ligase [Tissierellia bacterium]
MKKLGLHEIREEYLKFFESKDHLRVHSYSLIPNNDKSLLLIGAGMAPLKKYFTGEATPPNTRMTSCQKCVRTADIENVGRTDRHATFFEMLGNFSFGDYFKKEAIRWAWEFLTVNLEIPEEVLWATVYYEDDEAYELWQSEVNLPKERIVKLGKEDNFWELEVGPSGPCSELHVDRGAEYGCGDPNCKPGCECDRFIEVWNLVFTQFDKDENGEYHPLSHPNIDTGMGLERLATILEETDNIFEIKAIKEIIEKIEAITGYKYKTDPQKDVSVRVITDHVRAMTFMISDTILPSNEGRGYVLRRLIRRAARHGRLLGIKEPFLSDVSDVVINSWDTEYQELKDNEDRIKEVILNEERKFLETLEQGINILSNYIKDMKAKNSKVLSGEDAFKLYDTYGFPLDLTKEILDEAGLSLDEVGFDEQMQIQRERARTSRNDSENIGWHSSSLDAAYNGIETEFEGYYKYKLNAKIEGIIVDNESLNELAENKTAIVLTNISPFYAEGGGQIGDTGIIKSDNFEFEVTDTIKGNNGEILHIGKLTNGIMKKGDEVSMHVDEERRRAIMRNHSATHLLHHALREVLGKHLHQAGSEVTDKGFRFDFTHFAPVSKSDLLKIEKLVNSYIFDASESVVSYKSLKEAMEEGTIGLFEDKYGDEVRIVDFGGFSRELCGGCHVNNTSEIGIFKILSESGISSGVRRIEAISGTNVYDYLNDLEYTIDSVSDTLKADRNNLLNRSEQILEENKNLKRDLQKLEKEQLKSESDEILQKIIKIGKISVLTERFKEHNVDSMRELADRIRDKIEDVVILFASENAGKINLVSACSKNLTKEGFSAGELIKTAAKITGGGGGGRPDMATAGGKDANKIDEALDYAYEYVKNKLQ